MPEFSFYRSWKTLDAGSAKTVNNMYDIWMNYFNSASNQGKETRQFYSIKEKDRFSTRFLENLLSRGISRKETFFSIIDSYSWAKNIDYNKIKVVIEHEHVSFPYIDIFEDYVEPKILMIYRDPRASIAGFYKGIEKKYSNWPDINEYFTNMSLEEWMNSCDFYKMYKYQLNDRLKLVKNEELSQNTKEEMKKIANWLRIDYDVSLIKSTYPSSIEWIPDSCYLSKEEYNNIEKFPGTVEDFFDPIKVKQRWLSVLNDKRDIIMIEFLFNDFMKEFRYERITPNTYFMRLKGLYYYILPHRGSMRFNYYPAHYDEIERVRKRLLLLGKNKSLFFFNILPLFIKSLLINLKSIINHLIIYFIPRNRWSRYDNPKIEILYRSVPIKSIDMDKSF